MRHPRAAVTGGGSAAALIGWVAAILRRVLPKNAGVLHGSDRSRPQRGCDRESQETGSRVGRWGYQAAAGRGDTRTT
jgi:hypothetical protein